MSLTLIEEIKTKGSYDYEAKTKVETIEKNAKHEYIKEVCKYLKDTFKKYNVKYIIGEFSGGNDSGGFDSVYLANDKVEEIKIREEDKGDFRFYAEEKNIYNFEHDKEKKISVFYTTTDKHSNLLDRDYLQELLYHTDCLEEFGSFAGEFSVDGTVKFDVFNYKWTRDGTQWTEISDKDFDEGQL